MQIADMMKELREKGLGEAEVASAHAQWLEEEDDKALKNLMRSVKKGFKKGRQRVAVCPRRFYYLMLVMETSIAVFLPGDSDELSFTLLCFHSR